MKQRIKRIAGSLNLREVLNIAIAVMFIGGIVFTFGFGTCIYLVRQEFTSEANRILERDLSNLHYQIDEQLLKVENQALACATRNFGTITLLRDGKRFIEVSSWDDLPKTEESCIKLLSSIMDDNPVLSGAVIAYENLNLAAYGNRFLGEYQFSRLDKIYDYHHKEWYSEPFKHGHDYWSNPFRESSFNKVIACYNIPMYFPDGKKIGVLTVDLDTEEFTKMCASVTPYPGIHVLIADRDMNFISHSDSNLILSDSEDGIYSLSSRDSLKRIFMNQTTRHTIYREEDGDAFFIHFTSIDRSEWNIAIVCPYDSIFGGITRMKKHITIISFISILFMLLCLYFLFSRLKNATISHVAYESELSIAAQIQQDMLPNGYPAFKDQPGIDICGSLKPAKSIGGDLYDYVIRENKLFFTIGDVSGKGVPAALHMAMIRSLFRNITQRISNPSKIVSKLNLSLLEANEQNMFCTIFIGVLDLSTGELEYCNAGHNCVYLSKLKDGNRQVGPLECHTNIAIGVLDDFEFKNNHIRLNTGDSLILYTDGVTEAENKENLYFGEKRLKETLILMEKRGIENAKEYVETINALVEDFEEGTIQSDDVTLLVLRLNSLGEYLSFENNLNELPKLTAWVEKVAKKENLSEDKKFQLNLILDEIAANIIEHAYHDGENKDIEISCFNQNNNLLITIKDSGEPFDPTKAPNPDVTLSAEERKIGGLGILLVREYTREIKYLREGEYNIQTLLFEK